MDLDSRLEAIKAVGIDHVVAINFTREVSQLSASEFIQHLSSKLNLKALVCGQDFALGKGREGDVPTLTRLGAEYGYEVVCQDVIREGDLTVSSTAIREALSDRRRCPCHAPDGPTLQTFGARGSRGQAWPPPRLPHRQYRSPTRPSPARRRHLRHPCPPGQPHASTP